MNSTFLSVTSDQLGCGSLPSGYDEIIFELSEGKPVYDIFYLTILPIIAELLFVLQQPGMQCYICLSPQ